MKKIILSFLAALAVAVAIMAAVPAMIAGQSSSGLRLGLSQFEVRRQDIALTYAGKSKFGFGPYYLAEKLPFNPPLLAGGSTWFYFGEQGDRLFRILWWSKKLEKPARAELTAKIVAWLKKDFGFDFNENFDGLQDYVEMNDKGERLIVDSLENEKVVTISIVSTSISSELGDHNDFLDLFNYFMFKRDFALAAEHLKSFMARYADKLKDREKVSLSLRCRDYAQAEKHLAKAKKTMAPDDKPELVYFQAKLLAAAGKAREALKMLLEYKDLPQPKNLSVFFAEEFGEHLYREPGYVALQKEFSPGTLVVGEPAPALKGKYLDGKNYNSGEYLGKVLLIDFWASWCKPCREEMAHVIGVFQAFHASGFAVLGVSLDNDARKANAFVVENKISWKQIFDRGDAQGANAKTFNVSAIPAAFLIDKKGIIRYLDLRGRKMLEEKVARLLKE